MGFNDHSLHDASLISAKELQFTYLNSQAPSCQIADCQIEAGRFIVLCGKSGSGKSSFLKLVNGLIPDYYSGTLRGKLRVANYQAGQESVETFSNQVASVFQNPASQFFYREVKHEPVFPCENQGLDPKGILERLETLANDFQFQDLLEADMHTLSGGQKQRVAIATALMQGSPIMVFDEPTANLDKKGIETVRAYLKQLKESGKTIVIAEHRLHYLLDLADDFFYFDNGRLEATWSPKDMQALSKEDRENYGLRRMDSCPLFENHKKVLSRQDSLAGGLFIDKLKIKAGSKDLLSISEMGFERGQITGILGANGIGKSQLAAYLTGVLEDKASSIYLDGSKQSAKERLEKTSLVMQDVTLQLFAESVAKEINLGHKEAPQTQQVVSQLSLDALLKRHPASLSGGEQQRVMIAAGLLSDKEIFIFDEPSSGLDLLQVKALAALLKELRQEGKVVILISHDEELLAETCDASYQLEHYQLTQA
ncbi:ABC transporter, ATP-binding protein [Streptococcus ictaluri 707-05]|uniref:ABC transporter, ATP-binding protein n=2 Tax=Streptococcus ictaluri TaxID=380397 RepID=G5JZZ2_9STRE|nr:ABC transporter, ATP-binding protein [Streptococcus ictaluri 707-05]